jgi:hypothetical protein
LVGNNTLGLADNIGTIDEGAAETGTSGIGALIVGETDVGDGKVGFCVGTLAVGNSVVDVNRDGEYDDGKELVDGA